MAAAEDATIRLDHFLQRVGAAQTGGHAKVLIQDGQVRVDGQTETRRRRKLAAGCRVEVGGEAYAVG